MASELILHPPLPEKSRHHQTNRSSTPRKSGVEAGGFGAATTTTKAQAGENSPADSNAPQKRSAPECGTGMEGQQCGSPDSDSSVATPRHGSAGTAAGHNAGPGAGPDSSTKGTPSSTRGAGGVSSPESDGTPSGGRARRLSSGTGDGAKRGEDKNRHKAKESVIFSPALRPEHHEEVRCVFVCWDCVLVMFCIIFFFSCIM